MSPRDIASAIGRCEKGSADVLADWLSERGLPWHRVTPNNSEGEVHTTACKWCLVMITFPPHLAKHYANWSCTACTPVPSSSLLVRTILGMLSIPIQVEIAELSGMKTGRDIDECLRSDPNYLLETTLVVIDR